MIEHLLHYFPFLNKEFRQLEENELQSEKTFKELFPDEPIDLSKLKAIATYQKAKNDFTVTKTEPSKTEVLFTVNVNSNLKSKNKNGKV